VWGLLAVQFVRGVCFLFSGAVNSWSDTGWMVGSVSWV